MVPKSRRTLEESLVVIYLNKRNGNQAMLTVPSIPRIFAIISTQCMRINSGFAVKSLVHAGPRRSKQALAEYRVISRREWRQTNSYPDRFSRS